jgi:hypothetical protein
MIGDVSSGLANIRLHLTSAAQSVLGAAVPVRAVLAGEAKR